MKYTIRTNELSTAHMFIMHAEGCKDIAKDAMRHGGYTQTHESNATTPELAAAEWLINEGYAGPNCVYESEWQVSDIKILPCCRKYH